MSVGFAPEALVTANVKALQLRGGCGIDQIANVFSIKTEDYPLSRRLFIFTPYTLEGYSRRLVNFIKADDRADAALALPLPDAGGEEGAEVPHSATDQQIETARDDHTGSEHVRETDADPSARRRFADMAAHTERLSITYRFAPGSEELDTKARQDIGRLARYLQKNPDTCRRRGCWPVLPMISAARAPILNWPESGLTLCGASWSHSAPNTTPERYRWRDSGRSFRLPATTRSSVDKRIAGSRCFSCDEPRSYCLSAKQYQSSSCLPQIPAPVTDQSCAATSSANTFIVASVALTHLRRAQTSIALGARGATACHFPRVPSLKAFGRLPRCKPHRCDRPASETLNST